MTSLLDVFKGAIRVLVDTIFREREARIWGEGTTACASDSKSSVPGIRT